MAESRPGHLTSVSAGCYTNCALRKTYDFSNNPHNRDKAPHNLERLTGVKGGVRSPHAPNSYLKPTGLIHSVGLGYRLTPGNGKTHSLQSQRKIRLRARLSHPTAQGSQKVARTERGVTTGMNQSSKTAAARGHVRRCRTESGWSRSEQLDRAASL